MILTVGVAICIQYNIFIRSKDETSFTFSQLPYTTGIYRMICIQQPGEGRYFFRPAGSQRRHNFVRKEKMEKSSKTKKDIREGQKLIETVMIINTVVPQRRSITYCYFSKIDLYLVRINPIRLDPKSCPSILTFSSKAF